MLKSLLRKINSYRSPHYYETKVDGFQIVICVGKEETASKKILNQFTSKISDLFPQLFSIMESTFEDYDQSDNFPPSLFFMDICLTSPNAFMGEDSRFHIRFEFDIEKFSEIIPLYDFFLAENLDVVHHQPVF